VEQTHVAVLQATKPVRPLSRSTSLRFARTKQRWTRRSPASNRARRASSRSTSLRFARTNKGGGPVAVPQATALVALQAAQRVCASPGQTKGVDPLQSRKQPRSSRFKPLNDLALRPDKRRSRPVTTQGICNKTFMVPLPTK
jgi:hypothetical protein